MNESSESLSRNGKRPSHDNESFPSLLAFEAFDGVGVLLARFLDGSCSVSLARFLRENDEKFDESPDGEIEFGTDDWVVDDCWTWSADEAPFVEFKVSPKIGGGVRLWKVNE